MAAGKKSFVLYSDYKDVFSELSDKDAGQLIKHIFSYVNDENPVTENPLVKLSFIPIKNQLKRDLKDWDETRQKRSEAGKAGMAKRWHNDDKQPITNDNTVIDPITKITVNGTVNVNDNVTVTDRERRPRYPIENCLNIALADPRFVRANKCNQHELELFNNYLEKTGRYDFDPLDYKKYFSTIKDKYPTLLKKELSIDDLKEIARQMDEQQKLKAV